MTDQDELRDRIAETVDEYLTPLIVSIIRQTKADALREAVNSFEMSPHISYRGTQVRAKLKDIAARIEREARHQPRTAHRRGMGEAMNWDQQLIEACTETDGSTHPHTGHVLTGAKWMRDQLRTNEAIEQAADILSFETTGGCYPKADEQCRHVMRRVLNTLLGEDQ